MATFISDADLTTETTAANTQQSVSLAAHWTAIIPKANIRAYNKLRSIILGRRYSQAQFLAWGDINDPTTDGYDWNMRLGVVYAFLEAAKGDSDRGAAYRAELKELLDELATLSIITAGVLVVPKPGKVGSGAMDTSHDRILLDTPDGSGEFTPPTHRGGTIL